MGQTDTEYLGTPVREEVLPFIQLYVRKKGADLIAYKEKTQKPFGCPPLDYICCPIPLYYTEQNCRTSSGPAGVLRTIHGPNLPLADGQSRPGVC